jgi:hypothetical protein
MMGPKQEPDNSEGGSFKEWQDWCLPDKSEEFEYSDSTQEHIMNGKSQHFHYEGNDLPEKM